MTSLVKNEPAIDKACRDLPNAVAYEQQNAAHTRHQLTRTGCFEEQAHLPLPAELTPFPPARSDPFPPRQVDPLPPRPSPPAATTNTADNTFSLKPTWIIVSKLNWVPFHKVNSPLWVPVMQRLPSGVQASEFTEVRICKHHMHVQCC